MRPINPILNHPYDPPRRHYHTALDASLDYDRILDGRRVFRPDLPPMPVSEYIRVVLERHLYGTLGAPHG